ncbi:MAG: AI-2E family transporter [Anaerolineae bacterium]|nr:AI-2E family transporter [Anaerolineae bacterium]
MAEQKWSDRTKQWVLVGVFILAALAFYQFRRILGPVALALILAYVLNPAVSFLHRRLRVPRTLAALLVLLVLLGVIALVPILVIPALVDQVRGLNLSIQQVLDFAISILKGPIVIAGFTIDTTQLYDQVSASLQSLLSSLAASSVNLLLNIASGLAWFVLILVLAFWFVKDAPYLREKVMALAPVRYQRDMRLLLVEVLRVWQAFFQGQLILCLVVGVAVAIAMTIVGLPYALLMGLIAGVLELIPNVGPTVAAVPAVLVALLRGSSYLPLTPFWFAVLVAGLYVLIQQVENNVLVPRIMGYSLNLHPLVVLLGVLMGASLAGVLGIFLAAPTLATLRVVGRYVYKKLLDEEPFPAEEAKPPAPEPPIGALRRDDVQAVLFDLDGTLIDSDDSAIRTWARRLRPVNWLFRNRDPEPFLRHLVMGGEGWVNGALTLLDHVGLDGVVFALRDALRVVWRGKRQDFLPVDNIGPLLERLGQRYRLGVVTTRDREAAHAFLRQIGFDGRFEVVITREDVRRLKPHPQPVQKAAEALGLTPSQVVMVGDTSLDIRSAKAAGAQTVGVLCGLGMLGDLMQADLILTTTADLAAHLLD